MNKEVIFQKEINLIEDEKIKNSCRVMVNLLPEYIFHIAASSTGKYHPEYATGEAGLIRHIKAAVHFAKELFNIYKFDSETKDLIIMALILHDGLKKGLSEEKYTKFNHPLIVGDYIKENKDKLELSNEQIEILSGLIASHMGKWNTNDFEPGIILPLPKTPAQKFVHMCDFLASRKSITIKFDKDNNILE